MGTRRSEERGFVYEVPRWVVIGLGMALLATVVVLAQGVTPRPAPAAAGVTPPPDTALANTWSGQRLSEVAGRSLLAQGDRLWIGGDVDGLAVLAGDQVRPAFPSPGSGQGPGVHIAALLAGGSAEFTEVGDALLAGYVALAGEPTAEFSGQGGLSVTLDQPAFGPGAGEAGLARWDGETWTPLWTAMAVWGIARAPDDGLYLATNDGVYLLKGRQAHHLGLDDTLCFGLLHDEAARALYVGALGGIWHYHGGSWQHVLDLPERKAVAFARDGAGRLYAATAAGLYTSGDGLAWQRRGGDTLLVAVLVLPDGRVLAGGERGIYEATGDTLQVRVPFPVNALAWHNDALYAAAGDGLWRLETTTQGEEP